jgi:hypothetical protein
MQLRGIKMGFIETYKRLERLCEDIMQDARGISAYIDEMESLPEGSFYVRSWQNDLKMLKHYRWIRNKIAHEPDCCEENMCSPEDALWLVNFYERLLNQTDSLSLYAQSADTQIQAPQSAYTSEILSHTDAPSSATDQQISGSPNRQKNRSVGSCIGKFLVFLLFAATVFLLIRIVRNFLQLF